jgi:hypothetical protein
MAFVLLLAATLATSAVLAAPPQGAQPRRSAIVIPDATDFVSQLWWFLSRGWIKNGSEVDPSGSHFQAKNGGQADPDGHNLQTKNGSMAEPDGSHLQTSPPATPNGDNGHQVDPNG